MTNQRRAWLDASKEHLRAYGKRRWRQKMVDLATKTSRFCHTCSTEKPSSEFYPSYKTQCRACLKAKAAPKQAVKRQYVKKWKTDNPDQVRKWYRNNRERIYANWRAMYARTPDLRKRMAEYHADWAKRNRGMVRANSAQRDARQIQATPQWADLAAIRAIYKMAARLTRDTGIPHEVDHIIPLRSSVVCGLHCESNLQILTKTANRQKSNHLHVTLPQISALD